jgi:hypothetical protein
MDDNRWPLGSGSNFYALSTIHRPAGFRRAQPLALSVLDSFFRPSSIFHKAMRPMDVTLASSTKTLPTHGRIVCRKCFTGEGSTQMVGKWQMVNDPAAWGSASPKVLILGFSKGFTQANAFRSGRFEDIPFKKMRPRLTEVLRSLCLLGKAEIVDQKMVASESEIGFGSLVRCSLSRLNAKGVLECTGQIIPKAFVEEISTNLKTCAQTYLGNLPSSIRLVLLLGTTDSYIKGCRNIVRSLHRTTFSDIDEVSYRTAGIVWVHASHPSPLNGHHGPWITGDPSTKPGRKQNLAMAAVRSSGVLS